MQRYYNSQVKMNLAHHNFSGCRCLYVLHLQHRRRICRSSGRVEDWRWWYWGWYADV